MKPPLRCVYGCVCVGVCVQHVCRFLPKKAIESDRKSRKNIYIENLLFFLVLSTEYFPAFFFSTVVDTHVSL